VEKLLSGRPVRVPAERAGGLDQQGAQRRERMRVRLINNKILDGRPKTAAAAASLSTAGVYRSSMKAPEDIVVLCALSPTPPHQCRNNCPRPASSDLILIYLWPSSLPESAHCRPMTAEAAARWGSARHGVAVVIVNWVGTTDVERS